MKRWLGRSAAAVAGVLALLLLYGTFVEPRVLLDERHYRRQLPGLAPEWDGAEIAVLADLQVGMWLANTGMIRRIVARVVEVEPAAVVLAGDFVYSEAPDVPVQVEAVIELLTPLLDAGLPTYAVLGNHDYAVEAVEELLDAFSEHGIVVLRNEAVPLPAPGSGETRGDGPPLHLVGLGPWRPGRTDVSQALDGVPDDAPRVVVMHNPASFPQLPPHSAPLSVAGHTHCGQVALPGTPHWAYLQLRAEERIVVDGFAPPGYGAEGNALFVTCGVGFSLVPVRINARPQVVFFELVSPP